MIRFLNEENCEYFAGDKNSRSGYIFEFSFEDIEEFI